MQRPVPNSYSTNSSEPPANFIWDRPESFRSTICNVFYIKKYPKYVAKNLKMRHQSFC